MDSRNCKHLVRLALVALFLLLAVTPTLVPITPALAQGGDEYELSWFTVGGGGEMSSADGTFGLSATAGEPATGKLSNGEYSLDGGFWGSGALDLLYIYLPVIQKH